MGLVLEMPHAAARRHIRAEALAAYAALVAYAEELGQKWGPFAPSAACVQLRLARMLWAALNGHLAAPWLDADPEWEALRQRFQTLTEHQPTHRHPIFRDAWGVLVKLEMEQGRKLPLLQAAVHRIPA